MGQRSTLRETVPVFQCSSSIVENSGFTALRFFFAFSDVNERYDDFSPVEDLMQHSG